MKIPYTLLHFTWCLPQTLLGLILRGFGHTHIEWWTGGYTVSVGWLHNSLFSLGRHIFKPSYAVSLSTMQHEFGHSKQSLILGPLYLIVIAIPGVTWFYIHKWFKLKKSYYWFYTEKWANMLAGLEDLK